MSAARMPAHRKPRLALVQGGKGPADPGGGGDDGDWDDFCHRIGWQGPAPEPDADFEKRLSEGLSSKPMEDDNVIDIGVARARTLGDRAALWRAEQDEIDRAFADEIRHSFIREALAPVSGRRLSMSRDAQANAEEHAEEIEAEGAQGILSQAAPRFDDAALAELAPDAARKPTRRARVARAALMLAFAAAAALAVTRLALSARTPEASIPVPAADSARATTAEQRVDDGALRAEPPEVAPMRAAPSELPTAKPAPGPTTPRVRTKGPSDARPEPPGMVVARRDTDAPTRRRASSTDRPAVDNPVVDIPALPGSRGVELAMVTNEASPRAAVTTGGWTSANVLAQPAMPWGTTARSALALPAPEIPASPRPLADTWSSGSSAEDPAGARKARAEVASWSLAGTTGRWVGASLTPSSAEASIGAMVQVDLAKALNKL